jgi:hypothetical protein
MKKHFISTDKDLNVDLANEVATLRGGMMEQAKKQKCKKQFTFKPDKDSPSITITNTNNGKSHSVPLFAYGEVRETLNKLF